jgi:hypothetical protein
MTCESLKNGPENEPKKNVEFLVVLGRGIGELSSEKQRELGLADFSPTPAIEGANVSGSRVGHTGKIEEVDPNKPEARYAGGIMNAVAAATLYWDLVEAGYPPEGIFVAAGRPPYLQNAPKEITEGDVLKVRIRRELKRLGGGINEENLVHTYPSNQDTFDDLAQSLQRAVIDGAHKVTFITVGLHIPRAEAMARQVAETLGLTDKIEIEFKASEDILRNKYKNIGPKLDKLKQTEAYMVTEEQEKQGLEDFKAGKYKFLPK